jgi:hypothetical protein
MSGQPNRYQNDSKNFRADYMKNLNLRSEIDKMNLEANNVYRKTGQLPALSQLPDTRTTTEILGDVYKLKTEMIEDLKPIASTQLAQMVINGIEKHPLNIDGGLFTFTAQRLPDIVLNLKKIYKYKIKGDVNDANTLVNYIAEYYTKAKSSLGGFKSFINRPQTTTGSLTVESIQNLARVFQELETKISRRLSGNLPIDINESLIEIKDSLYRIYNWLQTNENIILGSELNEGPDDFRLFQRLNNIYDKLPSEGELLTLFDRFDRSLENQNIELSRRILLEILGMLTITV